MTRDQILDCLTMVRLWWPHSDIDHGDPVKAAAAWHEALAPYNWRQVETALRALRDTGREHAPVIGQVVRSVRLAEQGAAPSGEDAQLWIGRHQSLLPYGLTNTPEDTVTAIERLTTAGAHEAVLRWVQRAGVYAIRMMPDPSRIHFDKNQRVEEATRRDMLRDYRERVVPEWEADPRAGVALEQACRSAGIDPATRPAVAASAPDELAARRDRKRLTAPEPDEPVEDGPVVGPAEALALFRRTAAANRMARARAEESVATVRAEQMAERARVEAELAERAARRDACEEREG
jgi:hypothetical protein